MSNSMDYITCNSGESQNHRCCHFEFFRITCFPPKKNQQNNKSILYRKIKYNHKSKRIENLECVCYIDDSRICQMLLWWTKNSPRWSPTKLLKVKIVSSATGRNAISHNLPTVLRRGLYADAFRQKLTTVDGSFTWVIRCIQKVLPLWTMVT